MIQKKRWLFVSWGCVSLVTGCQDPEFAFQPDRDLRELELTFEVQTPSEADILFVVDNSISMASEQDALIRSFEQFIAELSTSDTNYRIGLVSTDAVGHDSTQEVDCDGVRFSADTNQPLLDRFPGPGTPFLSRGNCERRGLNTVAYPRDGTRGRLLAAYDSEVYDINSPAFEDLTDEQRVALEQLFPTGVDTGPCVLGDGESASADVSCADLDTPRQPLRLQETQGVEWVLDRQLTNLNACVACGCEADACGRGNACFEDCAGGVAAAYIDAAFRANVRGLGIRGVGWEQGIRSALLSIGIEAGEPTVERAVEPPVVDLIDPNRPPRVATNTFVALDEDGNPTASQPWIRDDALFGVMFVTDEQDCSMPDSFFFGGKERFEIDVNQPTGSVCYQRIPLQSNLVSPQFMVDALLERRENARARVAVGLIGGLTRPDEGRDTAEPAACIARQDPGPVQTACRGLVSQQGFPPDARWNSFVGTEPVGEDPPVCTAAEGSRYIDFANQFQRRTYESICIQNYAEALVDFGDIAQLSCFDLQGILPAEGDPSNIRVARAERSDAVAGSGPVELPQVIEGAAEEGWYYVPPSETQPEAQICLNRIDRLIGDVYDVSILTSDEIEPTTTQTVIPVD